MIDSRIAEGSVAPPVLTDAPRELTVAQVRIELLRLCQRSDISNDAIIQRAREYEAYVLEARAADYPAPAGPANERNRSRRRGQT